MTAASCVAGAAIAQNAPKHVASAHPTSTPAFAAKRATGSATARDDDAVHAMQALLPNVTSFTVRRNDQAYRVWLYTPDVHPADGKPMPLLVLLDGNATFPIALQAARLQQRLVGPLVIAAIAPDDNRLFDEIVRLRDFTTAAGDSAWGVPTFASLRAHSTASDAHDRAAAAKADTNPDARVPTGGAAAFRDVIRHVILPDIGRRATIDPERTTLFGHSLGGFFVLDTALHDRCAFSRYIAASPSLWWNDRQLLRAPDIQEQSSCGPRPILLQIGGAEQTVAADASPERIERVTHAAMLDNLKDMAALLRHEPERYALAGPQIYPDGNHVSYLPGALSEAVQFATSK